MVLADFGVWEVFLSMIYFFLIFIWIMLLIQVSMDVFRDQEMSGIVKVLWLIFVIAAPYLGVFVYLIARGPKMAKNQMRQATEQQEAMAEYIKATAGTKSSAEELAHLAELHKSGALSDAEFAAAKAKIIG